MNNPIKVLLTLFGLSFSAGSFATIDEKLARTLIVGSLLDQVEWSEPARLEKSSGKFTLCTYKSTANLNHFRSHLKQFSIRGRKIQFDGIEDKRKVSACDALYVETLSQETIKELAEASQSSRTILIAKGKGMAVQGAHLGLYLGKRGKFNFELNPDAFIQTRLKPDKSLLALGQIISGKVFKQVDLLRKLVNFTSWPEKSLKPTESQQFQFCAYENNIFAAFAQHFLIKKNLKKKIVNTQLIKEKQSVESCDLLMLGEEDSWRLPAITHARERQRLLLIGDSPGFAQKGVHFNLLQPQEAKAKKFEVNLRAFNLTGHKPHFQLLNSAILVKPDYPDLARQLAKITSSISWLIKPTKKAPLNICLPEGLDKQFNFAKLIKMHLSDRLPVQFTQQTESDLQCDILYLEEMSQAELDEKLKAVTKNTIIVTSQSKITGVIPHFNIHINSKNISIEMNLDNLHKAGFKVNRSLFEQVSIIGGGSND